MPSKKFLCLLIASFSVTGCIEFKGSSPEPIQPPVNEEPDPAPEPKPEVPAEPATDTPYAEGQNLSSFYPIENFGTLSVGKVQRTVNGNYLEKDFLTKRDEPSPFVSASNAFQGAFVYSDTGFVSSDLSNQLLDTANYTVSWSNNSTVIDMFHEQIDLTTLTVQQLYIDAGFPSSTTDMFDPGALFSAGSEAYLETITSESDYLVYPVIPEGSPGSCWFQTSDEFASDSFGTCNFKIMDSGSGYAPATNLSSLIGGDLASAPEVSDIYRSSNPFKYKLVETVTGQGDIYYSPQSFDSYTLYGSWSLESNSSGKEFMNIGTFASGKDGFPEKYLQMGAEVFLANNAATVLVENEGRVRGGYAQPTGSDIMTNILLLNASAEQDVLDALNWP